jgi:hypothetical protein
MGTGAFRAGMLKMNGGRPDRRRQGDETDGAANRGDIERAAAHQWNICAEPGW